MKVVKCRCDEFDEDSCSSYMFDTYAGSTFRREDVEAMIKALQEFLLEE